MNIVVLGPQGSGKSTQAKRIAQFLNLPYFSTGKRVKEIDADSTHPLNSLIKADFEAGRLVSNPVINKIINESIEQALPNGGVVIDGTPRIQDQLTDLDEILKLHNQKIDLAIFVDTTIDECKKRITLRSEIEHRVDDTPQAIEQRLKIYFEETSPILAILEKRGILIKVDGNPDEETVYSSIISALTPRLNIK